MKRKQTNLSKSLPHPHHEHDVGGEAKCNHTVRRHTMVMLLLSLSLMTMIHRFSAVYAAFVSSTTASGDATTTTAAQILPVGRGELRRDRRVDGEDIDDDDDSNNNDDDDDMDFNKSVVGSIIGVRLVDSNIDLPIRSITNETQYNVYTHPTLNLNMLVDTYGTVGSVVLLHSYIGNIATIANTSNISTTPYSYRRIDSTIPFSLCGDTNITIIVPTTALPIRNKTKNVIDYDKCSSLRIVGRHTITVIPYRHTNATGRSGHPYSITYRVLNEIPIVPVGSITGLRLINSNIDIPIRNATNESQYNIYNYPTLNFNMHIDTNGTVGSVLLQHSHSNNSVARTNMTYTRIDSTTPFSLCGETNTTIVVSTTTLPIRNISMNVIDYDVCSFLSMEGRHTVTVIPYLLPNATGRSGRPYAITFRVLNEITEERLCEVPTFFDASWSSFNATYPLKVGEPQGLIVNTDHLIIFSGFTNGFTVATNRTYARDVRYLNSTWRRMDDMPVTTGITHMATVGVGPIVYLCGGYQGPHPGPHTSKCFQFNHSVAPGKKAQWSDLPALPNGGSAGGGMIYSAKYNTLYYAGGGQRLVKGSVHPVDLNTTWKLGLDNMTAGWLPSTPIPYRANHLSYVTHRDTLGNERHFMLAGQLSENECCGNLAYNYEFVPDNETWIERASMPIPRGHAASSTRAIGCGFIIAGGSINHPKGGSGRTRTDDISYYDVYNDTWTTAIGTLPTIGATPIVDIHDNGYMHFVNAVPISARRRISVQ